MNSVQNPTVIPYWFVNGFPYWTIIIIIYCIIIILNTSSCCAYAVVWVGGLKGLGNSMFVK